MVKLSPTVASSNFYESVTGRDATHVWLGNNYGQIIFTDGAATWRVVDHTFSGSSINALYAAEDGRVFASSGGIPYVCASGCDSPGHFPSQRIPTADEFTMGLCGSAGDVYAVGTLTMGALPRHALVLKLNGSQWVRLFETAEMHSFFACDVGTDGTLWLVGQNGVGRYASSTGFVKEKVEGIRGPGSPFFSALGAVGATRYIAGEEKQLAERGADGVWRIVFQPEDPRDLFHPRFVTTKSSELWWAGYFDAVNFVRGTPSGWTVYAEPRQVSFLSMYEPDATTLFLVGAQASVGGDFQESVVYKLTR